MSQAQPADGIGDLYPFLYAQSSDLDAVLAEVRRSTVEKATEIVALRERLLESEADRLGACAEAMASRFQRGGRLLAFGNGGSSTDAADVVNTFLNPSPTAASNGHKQTVSALPALSLTADIAVLTALSNDVGFDVVFARQIAAFATPADIAFGLSTSGGSANVLRAFDEARRRGLLTVGLAGYDGGKMAEADTIDFLFTVGSESVHRIQEAQTTLYHVLWELTQTALAVTATA